VAETSLTVPRIRYVVDTGTARVKRYGQRNQLERLHVEPISQAAADQRKGRCGRVGPGVCYRLYGEDDYARRPRYTDPEILRSSLAGVILRMLSLKLGDPAEFPFVEAPSERAIADGYRRLAELGALEPSRSPPAADDQRAAVHGRTPRHALTEIGRVMARLPIDVALGRMLVEAVQRGTMRELLVLVAFLSIQDPRERPADARAQADAAHAPFADPKSDFAGILKLWSAYSTAHEELTQSKLRDWCQTHFLSFLRMREWRELHRQLRLVTDEPGWAGATAGAAVAAPAGAAAQAAEMTADVFEAIHRCLLSGWPTQVARKDERGQYRGTRERRFAIFPGSALAKSPPPWLLAGQILDLGGRVHALLCARIEPAWIEQQAAHLVRRTWRDAHWSRARGAVVAFEQVTLFGLTLVEKRAVTFGAQDPALAHAVFVREALARGEIDARADFVRANARVLAEAREIEAKRRRTGLLRDESELAAFFAGKLPADVHTAAALDAWYRRATPAEQAALHWSLADVLAESPGFGARDFPAKLDVGGHALRLAYRFVPGDPADGVTLHVPLAFVNAVSAARCEWLVPGLLADKVAEAIRGLPKPLRRNFVPAPDFARAFVEAEAPRDEPLFVALARYLQRVTGVEIRAEDFAGVELPPHLHMNFRVHDEQGATLAESRDLAAIQAQWTGAARTAFSRRAEIELTREHVEEFDFEDIPDAVVSPAGLTAFPALVDLGESVALRVFERRDEAQAEHRRGVERLLRRALADVVKRTRKQLPIKNDVLLKSAAMDGRFGAPAVRDDRKGPSQSAATAGRSGASAVKDDRKGPSQSAAMDGRFGPSAGRGERENSSRSVVADARGDSIRRAVDGRPGLAALAGGRAGSPSPLAALSALRDARRPIQPPPGVADALRDDLVEAALREQLARHDLDLRRRADFERVREAIARGLFPAAVERLALAEAILAAHAELRPLLEPPLIGFARANYDDLREQLGELLFPGFLRELDAARLAHYPRYLRAMRLRAERLRQDPARDQARMLAVQGYWREYLKRRAARGGDDAELSALRWLIEELRVSTFAQELGTTEPVSPKRIAKLIESLR
ncbi:MAG TPA: ATP-dependent RNA helicase HrpA, partial [Dokdonella sp.]